MQPFAPANRILVIPSQKPDGAPAFVSLLSKHSGISRSERSRPASIAFQGNSDLSSSGLCPAPGTKPILSALLRKSTGQPVASTLPPSSQNQPATNTVQQMAHQTSNTTPLYAVANSNSEPLTSPVSQPTGLGFIKLGESSTSCSPFLNVTVLDDASGTGNCDDPTPTVCGENDLACDLGLKIDSVYSLAGEAEDACLEPFEESQNEGPADDPPNDFSLRDEQHATSEDLALQGEEICDEIDQYESISERTETFLTSQHGSLSPATLTSQHGSLSPSTLSGYDTDDGSHETETASETDSILGRRLDFTDSEEDETGGIQEAQEVARELQIEQAIIRRLQEPEVESSCDKAYHDLNQLDLGHLCEKESDMEGMHETRPIEREELLDYVLEKILPDMTMPDAVRPCDKKEKDGRLLPHKQESVKSDAACDGKDQEHLAHLLEHDHTYASTLSLDTSCELCEDGGIRISGQILLKVTPVPLERLYSDPFLKKVSRGPLPYSVERTDDENPLNLKISNVVSLTETPSDIEYQSGYSARSVLSENTSENVSPQHLGHHYNIGRYIQAETIGISGYKRLVPKNNSNPVQSSGLKHDASGGNLGRIPKRHKKTKLLKEINPTSNSENTKERAIPFQIFEGSPQQDENKPSIQNRNLPDSLKETGRRDEHISPRKLWRLRRRIKTKLKRLRKQVACDRQLKSTMKHTGLSRAELWKLQYGTDTNLNRIVFQSGILDNKPHDSNMKCHTGLIKSPPGEKDQTRKNKHDCKCRNGPDSPEKGAIGTCTCQKRFHSSDPMSNPDCRSPGTKVTKVMHIFKIEMNQAKEKSVTFVAKMIHNNASRTPLQDTDGSGYEPGTEQGAASKGDKTPRDTPNLTNENEQSMQCQKLDRDSEESNEEQLSNADSENDTGEASAERPEADSVTEGKEKIPFVKRPVGRPRKKSRDVPEQGPPLKRGRGRPPGSSKVLTESEGDTAEAADLGERLPNDQEKVDKEIEHISGECNGGEAYKPMTIAQETETVKRPVGRPSKKSLEAPHHELESLGLNRALTLSEGEPVAKRPRGRPRGSKKTLTRNTITETESVIENGSESSMNGSTCDVSESTKCCDSTNTEHLKEGNAHDGDQSKSDVKKAQISYSCCQPATATIGDLSATMATMVNCETKNDLKQQQNITLCGDLSASSGGKGDSAADKSGTATGLKCGPERPKGAIQKKRNRTRKGRFWRGNQLWKDQREYASEPTVPTENQPEETVDLPSHEGEREERMFTMATMIDCDLKQQKGINSGGDPTTCTPGNMDTKADSSIVKPAPVTGLKHGPGRPKGTTTGRNRTRRGRFWRGNRVWKDQQEYASEPTVPTENQPEETVDLLSNEGEQEERMFTMATMSSCDLEQQKGIDLGGDPSTCTPGNMDAKADSSIVKPAPVTGLKRGRGRPKGTIKVRKRRTLHNGHFGHGNRFWENRRVSASERTEPVENQPEKNEDLISSKGKQEETVLIMPLQSEHKEIASNAQCKEKIQVIYMPSDLNYQNVDPEIKVSAYPENCDIQVLKELLPSIQVGTERGASEQNETRVTSSGDNVNQRKPEETDDTVYTKNQEVTLDSEISKKSNIDQPNSAKLSRIDRLKAMLKAQEQALVIVRQKREESKKVIDSIDLI